jgi:putative peptidoglycan lipid II flippase
MSLSQVSLTLTGLLAAFAGPGVKTYLMHGSRLIWLPMALTSAAMATAMLPSVTNFLIRKEHAELSALIGFSRRVDLVFMMPAALGLMFFGLPIIQMLFQHGAWTAADSVGVYWVLLFMAPSLLIFGSIRLILPLFYARQDVMTPVRAATAALAVSLLAGALATFVFNGRHVGLAIANLLGTVTNYLFLKRRIQKELGPVLSRTGTSEAFFKCLSAGVIAIGGCALIYFAFLDRDAVGDSTVDRALRLMPLIGMSALIYFVLCRVFNVPDADRAFELIRRRLKPAAPEPLSGAFR